MTLGPMTSMTVVLVRVGAADSTNDVAAVTEVMYAPDGMSGPYTRSAHVVGNDGRVSDGGPGSGQRTGIGAGPCIRRPPPLLVPSPRGAAASPDDASRRPRRPRSSCRVRPQSRCHAGVRRGAATARRSRAAAYADTRTRGGGAVRGGAGNHTGAADPPVPSDPVGPPPPAPAPAGWRPSRTRTATTRPRASGCRSCTVGDPGRREMGGGRDRRDQHRLMQEVICAVVGDHPLDDAAGGDRPRRGSGSIWVILDPLAPAVTSVEPWCTATSPLWRR